MRNKTLRIFILLVLLISQAGVTIFFFSVIQPELKNQPDSYYASITAATGFSNPAINPSAERPVLAQIFEGFAISGIHPFYSRSTPPSRQIHAVFGYFVKVSRLSPAYILNRTLII